MHKKQIRDNRRKPRTPFQLVALCPSDGIERNVTTQPSRKGDNYVRVRERTTGDPLSKVDYFDFIDGVE